MALGSSAAAAAATLEKMAAKAHQSRRGSGRSSRTSEQARRQDSNAKGDRLLQLLREFPDKMVIFTQFRATQEMLRRKLDEAGHDVAVFHGGLSRLEKEAAIEHFRGPARLLLATEAGSEGRNCSSPMDYATSICHGTR